MTPPPARLLDVTRLVSRAGRGPLTGVDRVELAYLEHLLGLETPLFALARGAPGYALLDRTGAQALHARITGTQGWGRADWIARLHLRQPAARRRAMSDLRRLALAASGPRGLGRMLRRHLPAGTAYLNIGHTNLATPVFDALARVRGARSAVFIHDTIPLDFPNFCGEGVPEAFTAKIRLVGARADLVICNSRATLAAARRHFAALGPVPEAIAAHLGVTTPRPDPATFPDTIDRTRPFFVVLGTIEPRKNHALLLDVWDELAARLPPARMPQLVVIGARGWRSAALLERLDTHPLRGRDIHVFGGLSDGAVAAVLCRASALLFPSHAEGFGLPAAEAAALGVPVIASRLAVFEEVLGDYPVYPAAPDPYSWRHCISALAEGGGAHAAPPVLPGWQAHFRTVLSAT